MLGQRLKETRERSKLTQHAIAEYLKISRPTYTRYENGSREPDLTTLFKLASIFNCSVSYLIGETDDPSPKKAQKNELTSDEFVDKISNYLGRDLTQEEYDKALKIIKALFEDE